MEKLPIDWATVDWVTVSILSGLAFLAALLGSTLALRHRFFGSILAAILFAGFYVAWTYYLRDLVGNTLQRPA